MQVREANQMVEEMMLMANISVAKKILSHYPIWALLRRHQTPSPQMFEPLLKAAAAVGIEIDVSSSRALAVSLDNAQLADPYFNKLIRILATRCMTQVMWLSMSRLPYVTRGAGAPTAVATDASLTRMRSSQATYICTGEYSMPDFLHYGLAAPLYTHFTSPIRRYADVVVHRFLGAAIGISALPHNLTDKGPVKAVAEQINYRHRNAQVRHAQSPLVHELQRSRC